MVKIGEYLSTLSTSHFCQLVFGQLLPLQFVTTEFVFLAWIDRSLLGSLLIERQCCQRDMTGAAAMLVGKSRYMTIFLAPVWRCCPSVWNTSVCDMIRASLPAQLRAAQLLCHALSVWSYALGFFCPRRFRPTNLSWEAMSGPHP